MCGKESINTVKDRAVLLKTFVESYSLSHDIRPSTVEQYKTTQRVLSNWNEGDILVGSLSDELVNKFLRDYSERGAKPHTVASKRRQLIALWRAAAEEGLCQPPKRVRAIRLPETQRDVWSADEVRRLVAELEKIQTRMPRSEIQTGLALSALVRAAWDTGMRRSDLFRLERTHAEHDGWLEVIQRKTGRLVLCRLSPDTKKIVLRTYDDWAPPRKLIWPGGPAVVRRLTGIISEAAKDIGLKGHSKPFKKLRRSSITAVEQQAPGAGYLQAGHTNSSTTIRFYLNPAITQMGKPMPETL